MCNRSNADSALLGVTRTFHELLHGIETLVNQEVRALPVVNEKLARGRVAGEDETKIVPFQAIADRAIVNMHCWEAFNNNSVALIDHAGPREIKFVNFNFRACIRKQPKPCVGIPCE